jgi:uncharacterized protein
VTKAFLTFAAVALLAAPALAQPAAVRLITMTGSGTVQAEPDRAWVSVGIEARALETGAARQTAAATMEAIQRRLKALGIPESAIRTSAFNVQQDWMVTQGQRTPRGYVVSNQVDIRVDDIGRLASVIDESLAAGANNIRGVRWDVADREALERQALARAYADARARADVIAAAAGSTLGDLYAAQEARAGAVRPTMAFGGEVIAAQAAVVADTHVSPGQIDIRATVTASFVIRR